MDFIYFTGFQMIPLLGVYLIVSFLFYRKRETSFIKQLLNLSLFIYIILVLGFTLLPVPISATYIQQIIDTNTEAKNNFVPLTDIYRLLHSNIPIIAVKQIGGNILLLLPLGFYAPLISNKYKTIKSVLFLGIAASLVIELFQFCISSVIGVTYRSFVIDDIILNSIGALIGFGIINLMKPVLIKIISEIDQGSDKNIRLLNLGR